MAISKGDRLPSIPVLRKDKHGGIEEVDLSAIPGRVALFGVPGAFTSTCSNAHMPSFIATADQFRERGVDRIICLTVNDPSVAKAWAEATGAREAGIEVVADSSGEFTKAIGMDYTAPQFGMFGRSKRFSALIRDGQVEVFATEAGHGVFEATGGDKLLAQV